MDKSKSRKPCWLLMMWTSCEKRVACLHCLHDDRTISVWPSWPQQYLIHWLFSCNNNTYFVIWNTFVYGYFSIRYEIYIITLLLLLPLLIMQYVFLMFLYLYAVLQSSWSCVYEYFLISYIFHRLPFDWWSHTHIFLVSYSMATRIFGF